MKKVEAMEIAPIRSKFVVESLLQMLSNSEKVCGKFTFFHDENWLTLDILTTNAQESFNLGITVDHCIIFYRQLFNDLLDTFLDSDTMGVSKYFEIKGIMGECFYGVHGFNLIGSDIALNFLYQGKDFHEVINQYHQRIRDYSSNIHSQTK